MDDNEFLPNEKSVVPQAVQEPEQPIEDPRLAAALEEQSKQRRYADMLRGFQQVLQGAAPNSGFKADFTMADQMAKRADEPVEQYKAKLGQEAAAKKAAMDKEVHSNNMKESQLRQNDFQLKLEASKLNFQDMQANSDPTSPQSKIAQDRVIEMQKKLGQPVNEASVRSQSGKQLFQYFDYLKEDLTRHYQNENARLDREQKDRADQTRLKMEAERNTKLDTMEARRQERQNLAETEATRRARQQEINTARGFMKDDPRFKKAMEQSMEFDSVEALMKQAEAGNQQAVGALGTKLARAMGEVGVLTDTDVVRYVAGQSWGRKLKDWFAKGATGELSPETLKGITSNLKELRSKLGKDVSTVYDSSASRMKAAYPDMDEKVIRGILGDPRYLSDSASPVADVVNMRSPKDGKIRAVPKDQVEAAKKDGGVVVE